MALYTRQNKKLANAQAVDLRA
ncbi:unnamed protein product [Acanthoscelides obtectus]|uniref:Uncharacterized protein n=1 Tax=Acanthoscelides obtectus TaxID=200917 RepID=A0A9P0JY58_ACAOB|nr:unnamed protein product [Acanthoscelides obtectus]CAK1632010.1 hypothetical protein AOBTE_LOCUS7304 [Acanthoscelides obtectus]